MIRERERQTKVPFKYWRVLKKKTSQKKETKKVSEGSRQETNFCCDLKSLLFLDRDHFSLFIIKVSDLRIDKIKHF